jgi:hypothetical protein
MPVVPFAKGGARASGATADMTPPPLDWALIAAAQMHSEGRLIAPDKYSKLPASSNIEDRRGTNQPEGDHVDDAAEVAALRTRRGVLSRGSNPEVE